MTDQIVGSPADAVPPLPEHGLCANCDAPLHGHYCHACGQSTHDPVRHVAHAIEEVFESFWHLDGRVFRTLRDLMSPGKTAVEYLAGHRVRYIPPLRLFVILSVLTFFIGAATIHIESNRTTAQSGGATVPGLTDIDISGISDATTVEEVERERDRLLAEFAQAREAFAREAPIPGLDATMIAGEVRIRGEADNRIEQLRRKADKAAPADATGAPAAAAAPATAVAEATEPEDTGASGEATPADDGVEWEGPLFTSDSEAFDPKLNPVRIAWLPQFANDWVNRKLGYAMANGKRFWERPELGFQAFMASLPSALFLLVPVFALLLKLAYLFKRRLYLEHMVVALYSHCFLLLALAATFLLSALGNALAGVAGWLSSGIGLVAIAILCWMPIYLLLMQKRVYRQGWLMTTIKFLALGYVYCFLLAFAASIMFIAALAKPV